MDSSRVHVASAVLTIVGLVLFLLAVNAGCVARSLPPSTTEQTCEPILSGSVALFGLLFLAGSVSRWLPGQLWKTWPFPAWKSLLISSGLLLLAVSMYIGSCFFPDGSS